MHVYICFGRGIVMQMRAFNFYKLASSTPRSSCMLLASDAALPRMDTNKEDVAARLAQLRTVPHNLACTYLDCTVDN
jgi:hypothetical protein